MPSPLPKKPQLTDEKHPLHKFFPTWLAFCTRQPTAWELFKAGAEAYEESLQPPKLYDLRDTITAEEAKALGAVSLHEGMRYIKAVSCGVKAVPRRGDWFLSGAIVEAYRAGNDHPEGSPQMLLARLVRTETVTRITVVQELK